MLSLMLTLLLPLPPLIFIADVFIPPRFAIRCHCHYHFHYAAAISGCFIFILMPPPFRYAAAGYAIAIFCLLPRHEPPALISPPPLISLSRLRRHIAYAYAPLSRDAPRRLFFFAIFFLFAFPLLIAATGRHCRLSPRPLRFAIFLRSFFHAIALADAAAAFRRR